MTAQELIYPLRLDVETEDDIIRNTIGIRQVYPKTIGRPANVCGSARRLLKVCCRAAF